MRTLLTLALCLPACRNWGDDNDKGDNDKDGVDSADTDTGEPTDSGEPTDLDGDGHDAIGDGGLDCDDGDASVSPSAEETPYDGVDNDCDEATPDDDLDGDGYGAEVDCDEADAAVHPSAVESCNELDDDCDGLIDDEDGDASGGSEWFADRDGDGFGDDDWTSDSCEGASGWVAQAGDCDDQDLRVHPDAPETCNEVDDNCDGSVDEGVLTTYYADTDGDGWGDVGATSDACALPAGHVANSEDCDDSDGAVSPHGTELCNEVDDDCDGDIDEDNAADAPTWYLDADSDGYGDAESDTRACAAPSGYVDNSDDCDDDDGSRSPETVWNVDYDGDGFGSDRITTEACAQPSGFVLDETDCDDTDALVNTDATELCNEVDDDCDGDIDDADGDLDRSTADTWYADSDSDGFGDADSTTTACALPSGYTDDDTDCDDGDGAVHPDATETCNGTDDDCDGTSDDGALGSDLTCVAVSCLDVLDDGSSTGDGLYWIDPDDDGDTSDAWQAWCDMTTDGGGWTKLFSSHYPTWWSASDWEDVADPEDDDYSDLWAIGDFEDSTGTWTLRIEVGNSATWNTGTRAHYTVWTQAHDPFWDSTDGSDYSLIDGEEPTTCGGFNGLHDQYYTDHGVYCMSSDVDSTDSYGCWWMQMVPLTQYVSASSYPGYLEGYGGQNVHTWQVIWAQ